MITLRYLVLLSLLLLVSLSVLSKQKKFVQFCDCHERFYNFLDAAPSKIKKSKKHHDKNVNYSESDESGDSDGSVYKEPVTKKLINVAESFKQRKNVIGAKMKCDENGCNPVEESDEIFSEESGSL